jgi:DNA-binding NtrC family response regulator
VLRLGSLVPRPIDVCFVTATNKNVAAEVAEGRFRKDFYFRLSGMTIHVPPLRERTPEIEPLARLFIEGFAARSGLKSAPELTAEVFEALSRYSWPGNIRELRNVVERAVLLAGEGPILPEHLAFETTGVPAPPPPDKGLKTQPIPVGSLFRSGPAPSSLSGEVESLERERIAKAMETCAGNQTRAAELLGMPRRTLLRKLDAYGIARPRKQPGTPP